MTEVAIRTVEPEPAAVARWAAVTTEAFGVSPPPDVLEVELSVIEPERALAAYVGGTLAGTAAGLTLELTVPGGTVPAAGVTGVGVLPTHRRRGVLTALMRRQLHELHAAGAEPLAVLWASEPAIYGRYGFGAAARQLMLTLPRPGAALVGAPTDPELGLRLAPVTESLDATAACYHRVARDRPGCFARDERWHRFAAADPSGARAGASELRCVLAEDAGGVRGYAWYATTTRWATAGADGTATVREVVAQDPAAYAALWRYLLDLDLMATVTARQQPLDDPLLELLADPRRATPTVQDGMFCRLVDVERALAARGYTTEVDVVLEVSDPFCPWNAGRVRLAGGPTGAGCTRTMAPADLSLSVTELGAAYLGGGSLLRLAAAGRVREERRGALRAASAAFAHDPLPWCPLVF